MLIEQPAFLQQGWLHLKLAFVAGLLVYTGLCGRMMQRLQRGASRWTSTQLRLWNEVATLFLFAIVFLAVLQHMLHWLYGLAGLVALGMLLMLGVRWYRKAREGSSGE